MSVPLNINIQRNARSSYSTAADHHQSQRASHDDPHTKNVVVLGGSYGGIHAATVLAQKLPPSHRVILIERNSHFNHLYVFPRFSVLPGHEHKAFIPYSSIFKDAPARPKTGARRGRSTTTSSRGPTTTNTQGPVASSSRNALEMGSTSSSASEGSQRIETASSSKTCTSSPSVPDVPEESSTDSDLADRGDAFERATSPSFARKSERVRSRDSSRHSTQTSLSTHSAESLPSSRSSTTSSSDSDDATSTAASSYTANSSSLLDAKHAGPSGIASELAQNASKARQEETLGRPEIQVTDLPEAVHTKMDLEGNTADEPTEEDVAEGFESSSPHIVLQATVTDISPTHVTVTPSSSTGKKSLWSIENVEIPYTHLVYALGSHLPDPLRTEARSKQDGVTWMQEIQSRVKHSQEIVLVGGGALGVEFATDIASVYPDKKVTLIHSRKQLLPNFDQRVHDIAYHRLKTLGVNVVLGERLALTEGCPRGSTVKDHTSSSKPEICTPGDAKGEGVQAHNEGMCVGNGRKLVKTTGGKSFECDLLLLCTGQQPNSSLMAKLSPSSVDPGSRLVRVHKTLQVSLPDPRDAAQQPFDARPPCGDCDCFLDKKAHSGELSGEEQQHLEEHLPGKLPNVYAIGDVADAFGALNAGYQAWNMADVATENILRDIAAKSSTTTPSTDASPSSRNSSAPGSPRSPELLEFNPAVNMLKLSLGLGKMVFQGPPVQVKDGGGCETNPDETGTLEDGIQLVNGRVPGQPEITIKDDPEDLGVEGVWKFMANADTSDMHL